MFYVTIINANGATTDSKQAKCPELKQLRDAVGGHIEALPYWDEWQGRQCVAFCNEEGKLDNLPLNIPATMMWQAAMEPNKLDDVLCGNIIIISADTPKEMAQL
jgi:hypothetical protein